MESDTAATSGRSTSSKKSLASGRQIEMVPGTRELPTVRIPAIAGMTNSKPCWAATCSASSLTDRVPGYAIYIDPPLGRVGLTEKEARKSGRPLLLSTRPMTRVGRAVERDETSGFMKVIADAETKQILGAAILGVEGDEAIHGLVDAMSTGVPFPNLGVGGSDPPDGIVLIPTPYEA